MKALVNNKPYIYLFRRTKDNSPVYVGQHSGCDPNYFTSGIILTNNLKSYGSERFWEYYSREIIQYCTIEELNSLEPRYIREFNTYIGSNSKGYNLTFGGESTRGLKRGSPSEEHRRKNSESNKGHRRHTPEQIRIIREYMSSRVVSQQSRDLISKDWSLRELIECPHCYLQSKSRSNMNRWHFDNCKNKKIEE